MITNLLNNLNQAVTTTGKYLTHDLTEPKKITDKKQILTQQQEEIELTQLKLKYLQNKISPLKTPEILQPFIKLVTNIKREKRLDYQRWSIETQKQLEQELWEQQNKLQHEIADLKRQNQLKFVEAEKNLLKEPIWLLAAEIINCDCGEKPLPLEVFFGFPKLHLEGLASNVDAAKFFPDVELYLAEELREFLSEYSTFGRKIDFISGKVVSDYLQGEASIKALFSLLKYNPSLILESEVNGPYLNFRIGYWGLNWHNYKYKTVLSRLPYIELLKDLVKARASQWQKTREKLINAGQNAATLDHIYSGDNLKNLNTIKDEIKFKKAGIELSNLNIKYTINEKDIENLSKILKVYYCVFTGLIADEYFLVSAKLPPLLPQLLPSLLENTSQQEEIIEGVMDYYHNVYKNLESNKATILPELFLEFAESLAKLADKEWAKKQIHKSLEYWLKHHNLESSENFDGLLSTVETNLEIEEEKYINKLNRCLALVGYEKQIIIEENQYDRGINKCDAKDYQGAKLDLDQAIALNPNWGEAYYYRGICLYCLEKYKEALEDYSLALLLNNNWAEAYNNRGNTYYKLWEYEKAIADYNQALMLNPNLEMARKNRAMAEKILENSKIKENQKPKKNEQTLSLVNSLTGHYNVVRSLAISPDGEILVSSSYDYTIKIWDLKTGNEIHTLKGHTKDVETIAITPDGKTIVSGSDDNTIKTWDLKSGKELNTLSEHASVVRSVIVSPNNKFIISGSGDKTIKIWDIITGKELKKYIGHNGLVRCLAISPDGQKLVSGSQDHTIKIWNLKSEEKPMTLKGHTDTVNAIVFSPDGQTIFSASDDHTIKQWQLNTGQILRTLEGHYQPVYALAMSKIGPSFLPKAGATLYSASGDKTIKIWQLNTGIEISKLKNDNTSVFALAIAPDDLTLVSGSGDGTIKIWR